MLKISLDNNATEGVIYGIIEPAKANRLNLLRYLEHRLKELAEHMEDTDRTFIDNLLPWSDKLPEICHIKTNK